MSETFKCHKCGWEPDDYTSQMDAIYMPRPRTRCPRCDERESAAQAKKPDGYLLQDQNPKPWKIKPARQVEHKPRSIKPKPTGPELVDLGKMSQREFDLAVRLEARGL